MGRTMNETSLLDLLGGPAKLLGALAALVGAVAGGWFASRASIMNAVTKRVESLLGHLEREIGRLTKAHADCEERQAKTDLKVEQLTGELRQAKQTIDSMERVKGGDV